MKLKGLSIFSSAGIAETYLKGLNIEVAVANEKDEKRAELYSHFYPETDMVVGDITDEEIFSLIIDKALKANVNFIMATPPCQGMSTAGKQDPDDPRNQLVTYAIDAIKEIKPKFVLLENVPRQLKTKIKYDGKRTLIPEYIKNELEDDYIFNEEPLVNAKYYGVAQDRERSIFLLSRKDTNIKWEFPKHNGKVMTMEEAIGNLPPLDPEVVDFTKEEMDRVFPNYEEKKQKGLEISKWHYPPRHYWCHVEAMIHTPEGHSAFENEVYYPKTRSGRKSKGYKNTYKRQWWDRPAYTITKYTSRIGSQENGHPGRKIKNDGTEEGTIYSDPRVLTIYELIILSSLPENWDIPEGTSHNLIREVIGEGIPPKLIEAAFARLTNPKEYEKMKISKERDIK